MDKLKQTLKRIAELQVDYSPENTEEMKERGYLITKVLVSEIKNREQSLKTALGVFGDDFDVKASDGIGRKAEAPWIRFFSESMSPSSHDGYYFVIHFSRDGRSVFFTVGCGATTWENDRLKRVPRKELARRVEIAEKQIISVLGSVGSFKDEIDLSAKTDLPKTFERATITAKRIDVSSIETVNLEELLIEGAKQLESVYQMQSVGADLTQSLKDQIAIDEAIRPHKKNGKEMDTLKQALKRIAELQVDYSHLKTPKMDERLQLTKEVVAEIKGREERLKKVLGNLGDDLEIKKSYRNNKAPWVLFYSKSMQFSEKDVYYFAIRFPTDGKSIYFTIGWSLNEWDNKWDADAVENSTHQPIFPDSKDTPPPKLLAVPPPTHQPIFPNEDKIAEKIKFARECIGRQLGSFGDKINLKGTENVHNMYEEITAVAKRIDIKDIEKTDVEALLIEGAEKLRIVYEAEKRGDFSPSSQDETQEFNRATDELINPHKPPSRQGQNLSGPKRKAAELRAMDVATEHFKGEGWDVYDTSANNPYDLLIEKDGEKKKVEVKGSSNANLTSIMMTRNEVKLHKKEQGNTILVLVSGIKITKDKPPKGEGGIIEVLEDWNINEWHEEPLSFQVSKPPSSPKE